MIPNAEEQALLQVAQAMALAARTAPKGRGVDHLSIVVLEAPDLAKLAREMERLGREKDLSSFIRDAENIRNSKVALLVGTSLKTLGLKYCGFCGFGDCAGCQQAKGVCAFNTGDLGIALGSAVAVAAGHFADNRIMYSMGMAAISLNLLDDGVKIAYGIPLSATGKNPFFDRK